MACSISPSAQRHSHQHAPAALPLPCTAAQPCSIAASAPLHWSHQPLCTCPCPAQLRDELRNQDGINEVTAEETTKLLLEISRLQQQNVQLRTDVMHRDEMLRIIQSQLAELNINADESDLWVAPCLLLLLSVCWMLGCQQLQAGGLPVAADMSGEPIRALWRDRCTAVVLPAAYWSQPAVAKLTLCLSCCCAGCEKMAPPALRHQWAAPRHHLQSTGGQTAARSPPAAPWQRCRACSTCAPSASTLCWPRSAS